MGLTITCVDLRGPSFRLRKIFFLRKKAPVGLRRPCCPEAEMALCRLEWAPSGYEMVLYDLRRPCVGLRGHCVSLIGSCFDLRWPFVDIRVSYLT